MDFRALFGINTFRQFLRRAVGFWRSGSSVKADLPFIATTDNSYDIGASGANRFRTAYLGTSIQIGASGILVGGTNTLEQRNGTNAQTLNVYRTYTDASNYSRIKVHGNPFSDGAPGIVVDSAGTGGDTVFYVSNNTDAGIYFRTNNGTRWKIGHSAFDYAIYPNVDNSYDIGLTSLRPRTIYAGTKVSIGGTAVRSGTAGVSVINIFNGTAPVGTLTNGCSIYSSAGELYTMDAAGNATLQTPHDDDGYWVFDSKDTITGKRLRIDMEKMMRFLNDKFGTDFIHEFTEEV